MLNIVLCNFSSYRKWAVFLNSFSAHDGCIIILLIFWHWILSKMQFCWIYITSSNFGVTFSVSCVWDYGIHKLRVWVCFLCFSWLSVLANTFSAPLNKGGESEKCMSFCRCERQNFNCCLFTAPVFDSYLYGLGQVEVYSWNN